MMLDIINYLEKILFVYNMEKNNFSKPEKILDLVRNTHKFITSKEAVIYNNSKEKIKNEELKGLYSGFYAGYKGLMLNFKISNEIKKELVTKKKEVDEKFQKMNIKTINNATIKMIDYKSRANHNNIKKYSAEIANLEASL